MLLFSGPRVNIVDHAYLDFMFESNKVNFGTVTFSYLPFPRFVLFGSTFFIFNKYFII